MKMIRLVMLVSSYALFIFLFFSLISFWICIAVVFLVIYSSFFLFFVQNVINLFFDECSRRTGYTNFVFLPLLIGDPLDFLLCFRLQVYSHRLPFLRLLLHLLDTQSEFSLHFLPLMSLSRHFFPFPVASQRLEAHWLDEVHEFPTQILPSFLAQE